MISCNKFSIKISNNYTMRKTKLRTHGRNYTVWYILKYNTLNMMLLYEIS
jgi:hypothetical protein